MKFNKLFFVLLLAFSCGGEVEVKKVKSTHLLGLNDSGTSPVRSDIKLDLNVREVMAVILPNPEDISPQYAEDDSEKLKSYFAHLQGYKGFDDPITKSMSQEEKADEVAEKVMVLGKVRDRLFEKMHAANKELTTLSETQAEIAGDHKDEIATLNNDLKCHIVKSSYGLNANKCYLKALEGSNTRGPKPFIEDINRPCELRYSDWRERYSNYETDTNLPAGEVHLYQLSTTLYEKLLQSPVITKCVELSQKVKKLEADIKKFDLLRAEIKTYVGSFLSGISELSHLAQGDQPKYFMLAVTKTDVKTSVWGNKPNPYDENWNSDNPENPCVDACANTKSIVEFDLKNKAFRKFQLALQMKEKKENFNDEEELFGDENPLGEYSLISSGQGMSDLKLEKVGEGLHDYVLRLSLTGPNYTLMTHKDGLELSVHPVYGVRFSGKTVVRYLDGTVRDGVLRIDLDYKK